MDDYLRETDRSNLSALMISGVWIEGLYLATQVAKINNNHDLKSMIGEQKLILNDLLLVLQTYKGEQQFLDLIADYQSIKSIYDQVKITYEIGEPQAIEKDGMMMVVQSETSNVSMSDETLGKIIDVTEEIRNKHLNI
jgi:t-SNARE complex subunit (syntaxin)